MKNASLLGAVIVAVFACGGSDDTTPSSTSAAGSSGSGGGSAGKGGASAGKGGASAGKGGASAGNGGASAGNGGASAGNGGASAGKAGMGGSTSAGGGNAGTTSAGSGGAGAGAGGTTAAGSGGTSAGSGGTTAGSGGTNAGSGGTNAGAGGTAAGAGGTNAGSGGTTAGSGGATAGAGGTSAGAGGSSAGSGGAASSQRWLMGYYPGYQQNDLLPADVRFDLLTHLAVGAVLPNANGTLNTDFYLGAQTGPALAKDLADKAHAAGKKAVLMVGGAGAHDGFATAAKSQKAALVKNLVDFAKAHSFDGLDLDWEPLPDAELDDFDALAKALRTAWPEAVLTVPLGGINVNFETVNAKWGSIVASLDQVNLMTYSMAGAYPGWKSWHHSPVHGETSSTPMSISSSVDAFLAAGIPAAKLGVGAGFYGLCYTSPVTGPGQALGAATATADDNQLAYRTLMSTYYTQAAAKWDATAGSAYLTFTSPKGPLGCTYISYAEEQGIAAQTDYLKSKGLGGMIVWTINEGHLTTGAMNARDPLLAAMFAGLQ